MKMYQRCTIALMISFTIPAVVSAEEFVLSAGYRWRDVRFPLPGDPPQSAVAYSEEREQTVGDGWTFRYGVDMSSAVSASPTSATVELSVNTTAMLIGGMPGPGSTYTSDTGRVEGLAQANDLTFVVTGPWEAGTPVWQPISVTLGGFTNSTLPQLEEEEEIIVHAQLSGGVSAAGKALFVGANGLDQSLFAETMVLTEIGAALPYNLNLSGWARSYADVTADTGNSVQSASAASGTLNVEFGEPVPLHQPRKIVLAFGHDAFVSISAITNAAGQTITYADPTGTHAAYTEESAEFDAFKQRVRDRVEAIFRDSAADMIEVTIGGIDPEASNIFFANKDIIPPTTLLGQAYTGIDQFDRNLNGEAFIMLGEADVGNPEAEKLIAETIAHEAGHLMGLIHVDPPGVESVMDYDVPDLNTSEYFVNGVYPREEPPGSGDTVGGVTHNPGYHLLRYVEGYSHDELTAAGIEPGSWDVAPAPPLEIGVNFELPALTKPAAEGLRGEGEAPLLETPLYDVLVLESQADPDEAVLVDFFSETTLQQLSAEIFSISGGSSLRLFASSLPGGNSDIALTLGDLLADGSTVLYPGFGDTSGFLQMKTSDNSFVTLASVALSVRTIPEPSTLILTCVCSLCALRLRRR